MKLTIDGTPEEIRSLLVGESKQPEPITMKLDLDTGDFVQELHKIKAEISKAQRDAKKIDGEQVANSLSHYLQTKGFDLMV